MTAHVLRTVLFFFPVQALVSAALLWWGICAVRARSGQLLMTLTALAWIWLQLRHDLVI